MGLDQYCHLTVEWLAPSLTALFGAGGNTASQGPSRQQQQQQQQLCVMCGNLLWWMFI